MRNYRWLTLLLETRVPAFVAVMLVLNACAPARPEGAASAQPAPAPAGPSTASVAAVPGLPDGPGYVAGGYGLLGVFDRAPHPNAARLFANWIASREGSQLLQETNRELSTRNDVDVSTFRDSDVPKPDVIYLDSYE